MNTATDRIERRTLIKATPARVWRALSNAEEFGNWFGANLEGKRFAAGQRTQGPITTAGYEHVVFDVHIERMEAGRYLSWRWHPAAVDASVDYSHEPTTLVEFALTEVEGGTLLTITESGFDAIPPERRLDAFRMNSSGWEYEIGNLDRHVTANGETRSGPDQPGNDRRAGNHDQAGKVG